MYRRYKPTIKLLKYYRGIMKVLIASLTLAILSCTSFTTLAASKPDISWSYVSAGYAKANISNMVSKDFKPDGYQVNGSFLFSESIYVAASYTELSGSIPFDDILGMSLDLSEFSARIGMRQAATENIDAFFEGGYIRSTAGVSGFRDENSDGFQAGAGFRYRVAPRVELGAAIRYYNADSSSTSFADLSARVKLTDMFDLYANYMFESDTKLLSTGVVLNF